MYVETEPFWRSQLDPTETMPDHAAWLDRHEALSAAADRLGSLQIVAAEEAPRWSLSRIGTAAAPAAATRALVFVSGNQWCAHRAASYTFVAETAAVAGAAHYGFAAPAMPAVRMDAVVAATVAMLEVVQARSGRVVLVGHGSGAHLAVEAALRAGRAPDAVVAVSGVYDLAPLVHAPLGDVLDLTADEVAAFSPLRRAAALAVPLHLVVGADETAEYHRQSVTMFEAVRDAGGTASFAEVPRRHHLSVVADLSDPASALSRLVQALFD